MKMCKTSFRPALIMVAVIMAAMLGTTPASAFKEVDQRVFGMVGIVRGQAARLNVVNTFLPPDIGDRSGSCQVELGFVDGEGRSLGRTMAALMPGQASFFDVFFDVFDDTAAASRLQIRAVIKAQVPDVGDRPGGRGADPCGGLLPSVEVYDVATGASMLVLHPAVIRGFNPQPDPPGLPGLR